MILWFDALDSTNAQALREAARLAAGTLVVAGMQSAGRGRRGRAWQSPAGAGFYGSLVLRVRPGAQPDAVWPQLAGVLTLETVRAHGGERAWLKWPNDVYAGERKLAGVLVETRPLSGAVEVIVLGVGVNLNQEAAALAALDQPATSLRQETGRLTDARAFAAAFAERAAAWLARLAEGEGAAAVAAAWAAGEGLRGRTVRVHTAAASVVGIVTGYGADGALHLRLADGSTREFLAGDVSLRLAPDA